MKSRNRCGFQLKHFHDISVRKNMLLYRETSSVDTPGISTKGYRMLVIARKLKNTYAIA